MTGEPSDFVEPGANEAESAPDTASNQEHGTTRVLPGHSTGQVEVGEYRLLQKVGEGGMGEVWAAEQERPVRRRVALKIIKRGMDTAEMLARFEVERQALALMSHPNVARVLDAGETGEGRPFFAMEYVKGDPITRYCDKNRLDTRQRVELLAQVCRGVQHAHQKGIIHRDLKPSNVLVAIEDDGRPVPKIIDFGVAKAINQHLTERTLYTELGQLIGTPEYMSPEQAEMSGVDIDTRTDVYALGVMLYELLAGRLPFDSQALRRVGLSEVHRQIREVDPPRPSTRVSSLGVGSAEVASLRSTDATTLARRLRGDLDWITMKALEKDRTRRYGSAAELAADLDRHLHDEPVSAGPPSFAYRAGKYCRRHRPFVIAAAVVALALVAGSVATLWQARVARQERDLAQQRFDQVRELARSLIFELHDEIEGLPGSTPARRVLVERGVEFLDSLAAQAGGEPELVLELAEGYLRIGDVQGLPYRANLGDTQGAIESFRRASALYEELVSADPGSRVARRGLAQSEVRLGEVHFALGESTLARAHFERAQEILTAALGEDPTDHDIRRDLIIANEGLGKVLIESGQVAEGVRILEQNLAIERQVLAENPGDPEAVRDAAVSQFLIASALAALDDPRALTTLREARDLLAGVARQHPLDADLRRDLVFFEVELAAGLFDAGDAEGALRLLEEGRPALQELADRDPKNARLRQDLVRIHNQEAEIRIGQGDLARATSLLGEAIRVADGLERESVGASELPALLATTYFLWGEVHRAAGDDAMALEQFGRALEVGERSLVEDPQSAVGKADLAEAYLDVARYRLELALAGSESVRSERCREGRLAHERGRELARELELGGSEIEPGELPLEELLARCAADSP